MAIKQFTGKTICTLISAYIQNGKKSRQRKVLKAITIGQTGNVSLSTCGLLSV